MCQAVGSAYDTWLDGKTQHARGTNLGIKKRGKVTILKFWHESRAQPDMTGPYLYFGQTDLVSNETGEPPARTGTTCAIFNQSLSCASSHIFHIHRNQLPLNKP